MEIFKMGRRGFLHLIGALSVPGWPQGSVGQAERPPGRRAGIFDAGVLFGPYDKQPLDTRPEAVLRELDKAGIEQALATSIMAVADYSLPVGNRHTLEVCRRYRDRLVPCASLLPSDYKTGERLGRRFRDDGFSAVAFFPGRQGWPLHLLSFRKCVEEMSAAGLPVFLNIGGLGDASQAAELFSHLQTPIVLRTPAGGGYRLTAEYLAVAESRPNFYFDVVNLVGYGSLELLVERLGVGRLLFSSYTPFFYPLSSLYLVQYARLEEKEKEAVLGGNLRRLLSA